MLVGRQEETPSIGVEEGIPTAASIANKTERRKEKGRVFSAAPGAYIYPLGANLLVGSAISVLDFDIYAGISGPTTIGSGDLPTIASTSTGDALGISGFLEMLSVPHDYVSGTPLSSTATWDNTTIAALGVTPGIYTWTWGSGTHEDSLKLFAGVPVPEPGSLGLLALGAVGLASLKWRSSVV